MTSPAEHELYERLVARFMPGATLLAARPLSGGVSARISALDIAQPDGARQQLIVRRHGAADLARNPNIAADEFKLLRLLHAAGYPAPAPVYLEDGRRHASELAHSTQFIAAANRAHGSEPRPEPDAPTIFPAPCLVVEYIAGEPAPALAAAPDLPQQLAAQLAALHQLAIAPADIAFLPEQAANAERRLAAPSSGAPGEQRVRAALANCWPPDPNPPVLLHGDFWPGNTLWRNGRLVAIVDWEDAARGDPLADLASSRLEILWAYGADAMRDFTQQYRARNAASLALNSLDYRSLPVWDLLAALRQLTTLSGWGLDPAAEQSMRAALDEFITQALTQLAAGER